VCEHAYVGLIAAFGPIWILSVAGYLARWRGLLADNGAVVLGQFLFYLAIPAAVFVTLAKTPLSGFAARPIAAFAASTALVIGVGWYAAGRWFGRKRGERTIVGMAAGYVNAANLGIPIALQVLGSVSFMIEVLLMQTLVLTPVILTVLDRHDAAVGRVKLSRIATLPVRIPVIMASALGVIASGTGFRPPTIVHSTLMLLAAAAVPTALFALGASLYRPRSASSAGEGEVTVRRTRSALTEISMITMLKLAVQPAIAFAIGAFALRLPHAQLLAVTVCSGLPSAQNTFVYAQHYRTAEDLATRAVLVTTTLSMATLLAAAALVHR
jgi:malonate transporter and related proteins